MRGLAGDVGVAGGEEFGVQRGVVGGQHGHIRRRGAGGVGEDAGFEVVVPKEIVFIWLGDRVFFRICVLLVAGLTDEIGPT